ncbi:unnamed protein product, partial [Heterosigma akashiwo]
RPHGPGSQAFLRGPGGVPGLAADPVPAAPGPAAPALLPPEPQPAVREGRHPADLRRWGRAGGRHLPPRVAGVMLTNHEGQSDAVTEFQDSMEQFFCWAFVLEMIIMVIGQTPGVYFTAGRFLFDFFVTVMSVVDIGLFTYGGFCASSSDDNVVLSLF